MPSTSVSHGAAPNRNPIASALAPLQAIATIVTVVRPARSATSPATTHPSPPEATTRNAPRLASDASLSPPAAKLAAMNSGTHVHIA